MWQMLCNLVAASNNSVPNQNTCAEPVAQRNRKFSRLKIGR